MLDTLPIAVSLASLGQTALYSYARKGTAVSDEAETVQFAAFELTKSAERSQALFGAKQAILAELRTIAEDCSLENWDNGDAIALDLSALQKAESIIRALPDGFVLPELAPEPDGSISMDWIRTLNRLYSLSVGPTNRLVYAWLDGTDKGHGVVGFDGINLPPRVLSDIERITLDADAAVRIA